MNYEPHPRFMACDPWKSIDEHMELLIDKVILEFNPETLDDDIPDLLDDWGERQEAIDYITDKFKQIRGQYD